MPFVSDTFTDTAGTDLVTGHVGEVGAVYTQLGLAPQNPAISDANRVRANSNFGYDVFMAAGGPAQAEYDVTCDVYVASSSGSKAGPAGRAQETDTAYFAIYEQDSAEWTLYKVVSGSYTELGNYSQSLSTSTSYECRLEILGATKKVYIDGVERISSSDNSITGTGKAGIWIEDLNGSPGNSVGLHIDNLSATYQSDLSITFDADGTNSGFSNSDADGAFWDDANDDPDSGSTDYIESASSHGPGSTSSEIWLRLADVPTDFSSLDSLTGRFDVQINGTVSNDTLTITAQIFDSDSGGSENALTDAQTICTEADTSRTQRNVTFGSLTGTKTQWNGAYCKILASYSRTGSDDGFAGRIFGALFSGAYTAAAGTFTATAAPTIGSITAAISATFAPGTHTATATPTIGSIVAAISAQNTPPTYTATAAPSMTSATAAASAQSTEPTYTATATPSISSVQASASATFTAPVYDATLAPTISSVTASASATFATQTFTATASPSAPSITAAASAQFTAPVYDASAAPSISSVTAAVSATFATVTFTASVSANLSSVTAAGVASFTAPVYTASVAAAIASAQASVAALFTPPVYTATLAATIAPAMAAASATFTPSARTATADAILSSAIAAIAASGIPPASTATVVAITPAAIAAASQFAGEPALIERLGIYNPSFAAMKRIFRPHLKAKKGVFDPGRASTKRARGT